MEEQADTTLDGMLASEALGRNELIEANIGFSKKLAKTFYCKRIWSGLELGELESAAFYGLCDAARRYDDKQVANFRTFSFLRIQGAMFDTMRRERTHQYSRSSRTPRTDKQLQLPKTATELRDLVNILPNPTIQLHVTQTEDGPPITEVSYLLAANPEQDLQANRLRLKLAELVEKLPEKERKIIRLYYFEEVGFEEMREHFEGASRSWLCRLHRRALARLKKHICLKGVLN